MGAFPDGFRRRRVGRLLGHDNRTAPRSATPAPRPRRWTRRSWQPPPPPPGPPARAQLRRSRTDKILGGVSGGLAEYSGIDALLWRVGFVALALAGGTGVVVYLLLWLLMPAGPPAATGHGAPRAARRPPAGPRSPVPGLTIAALLIVVGVARPDRPGSAAGTSARGSSSASALLVVGPRPGRRGASPTAGRPAAA